ncbi:MAG: lipid A export permease/ATP-binding protein MsbA [Deltaproteobacteria bacterium]|nr:lipid A export permease/ATP-binding protein MsbA [Deltaproteobacteria bacterium]
MQNYRRLLVYLRPLWWPLLLSILCMVAFSLLTSAVAFLVKPALDDIFINKDVVMLKFLPLVLILLFVFKGVANYFQTYYTGYVGSRIVTTIREEVYFHIQKLSLSFFTTTASGVLTSRIIYDVSMIQRAVSNVIAGLLKDMVTALGLVGVIIYRDWQLSLIVLVVFPLFFFPIFKYSRKMRRFSKKSQVQVAEITSFLQESFTGIRIIKAFQMESYNQREFRAINEKLLGLVLRQLKIKSLTVPISETAGGLAAAAVIWYGGSQVVLGHSTPGNFFSFMTALFMLYGPIRSLNRSNNQIQEALAAGKRVFEILDLEPEILDRPGAVELPPIKNGIRFENVAFAYDNENDVLHGVSLSLRKGETVAMVGRSGGGKSTILNLLPRFYDVKSGRIMIDDLDIRDLTQQSLRAAIAIVSQQTVLFNDTVRNNIAYGRTDLSIDDIKDAARSANAHTFIEELPERYDTIIGENGVRLSGGQQQRLSIARALLKNSPILLLDEATSALDTESERAVQEAIDRLMESRTSLVVAHRLSTIVNADRIVVLDKGRVVEEGTHKELLAAGGEYTKLYNMQFQEG